MSTGEPLIAPKAGSEHGFGLVFTAVFLLVGLYPWLHGQGVHWWSLLVAAAILLVTLLRPALLAKPNYWWFKFGMFLGAIVAPIVMLVVYVSTVVPMGVGLKLLGKDPLRRRIAKDQKTYWIDRADPLQPMKNQF